MAGADPSKECLISVDVEAAGPVPAEYSLLSIGACLVDDLERQFYVELQPTSRREDPKASVIHGLSLERLAREGTPPADAMAAFADWIAESAEAAARPILVGFNAAFDWMFVNDAFHRYLGRNPFGHAPLDVKSFYMGRADVPFRATSRRRLAEVHPDIQPLEHHALADALDQARLFQRLRASAPASTPASIPAPTSKETP